MAHAMQGFQYNIIDNFSFMGLFSFACSVGMVVGGIAPFIPQYFDIKRTQNTDGFSTYVCLTLLIANTLRILFWFGSHFETPLLLQSMIMNITMMIMMHLCVSIKRKMTIIASKNRSFTEENNVSSGSNPDSNNTFSTSTFMDFDRKHFWEWSDFLSYVEFIATFTVIVGCFFYLFLEYSIVVETIGFLAVFIEALLGVPQLYRNHVNKSTAGMSKKMVFMWTMGDTFKTVYFILRSAPIQFWICGTLQISIDIAILSQIFVFRKMSK